MPAAVGSRSAVAQCSTSLSSWAWSLQYALHCASHWADLRTSKAAADVAECKRDAPLRMHGWVHILRLREQLGRERRRVASHACAAAGPAVHRPPRAGIAPGRGAQEGRKGVRRQAPEAQHARSNGVEPTGRERRAVLSSSRARTGSPRSGTSQITPSCCAAFARSGSLRTPRGARSAHSAPSAPSAGLRTRPARSLRAHSRPLAPTRASVPRCARACQHAAVRGPGRGDAEQQVSRVGQRHAQGGGPRVTRAQVPAHGCPQPRRAGPFHLAGSGARSHLGCAQHGGPRCCSGNWCERPAARPCGA